MVRIIRELSPLVIRARGKIVNIGSITAVTPYVFSSIYNATKGALHAYSNTLRLELAPFGVKVMLIVTGGVKSRITRTERELSEESLYLPISAEYHRRVHHSQGLISPRYGQIQGQDELTIYRGRHAQRSLRCKCRQADFKETPPEVVLAG